MKKSSKIKQCFRIQSVRCTEVFINVITLHFQNLTIGYNITIIITKKQYSNCKNGFTFTTPNLDFQSIFQITKFKQQYSKTWIQLCIDINAGVIQICTFLDGHSWFIVQFHKKKGAKSVFLLLQLWVATQNWQQVRML